jgi:copper(I)-binding protein
MRIAIAIALASLLIAGIAAAGEPPSRGSCAPVVSGAWVRMTPMMPMGAGFFAVRNPCRGDLVLTGVASPRFADASMHETQVDRGISRMRPLARVVIHPGERVEFRAGGRHLMLMEPDAQVAPGGRVRVELRFADGRSVPVDFDVRAAAP